MEVLPYEDHQQEDDYVPLDPSTFPVTVLPVLSGWRRSPEVALARAAAFALSLFRPLRYNRDEIYEDAGNDKERGRFEYDPHVYLFPQRDPLRLLRFDAWIDRTGGESTLCLYAFGHVIEVHYVGRSDTTPYDHPSKH